jgi:hypothetical protein
MHSIVLALAIHNHQPVGNFDHVFAQAADLAYGPMLAALERHPRVRVALHYSGPLLDWLRPHRPDVLERVRGLAARGQVEILTGGYYEPILAAIPDADKRGQIEKLTRVIVREFGQTPEGLWLAERVWEPHLARAIADAGARYTIVDDTHFHAVGFTDDRLLGYYMTDEQGASLALFPSLKRLRYLIPWAAPEDVIAFLRTLAETDVRPEGRRAPLDLALMGDDGEKFGLWPGTYDHCWGRGWIDRFFDAVEAATWIEMQPPGEYRRSHDPAGRAYLPTSSYDEMGEWALPPDRAVRLARLRHELEGTPAAEALPFLRGGFWRHFLVKYDEINTLYRLAQRTSAKVHAMPDGPEKRRALDALWAGECNCTYWHGVFGGVYLPHIRGAAFSHLIAAEALADASAHPAPYAAAERLDADGDGREEVRLATEAEVAVVDPARGGTVVEWDDRAARRFLPNVVTRRREGYHAELVEAAAAGATREAAAAHLETIHTTAVRVKQPGLDQLLVYDRWRRTALRFHLVSPDTTLEAAWRSAEAEIDGFADEPYAAALAEAPGRAAVRLSRDAPLGGGRVAVTRTISLETGRRSLTHEIELCHVGGEPFRAMEVEEWGLGVFGAPGEVWIETAGRRHPLHERGALPAAERVEVVEAHSGLTLVFHLSVPAEVWAFPLIAISNSEGGYEQNFEGAVVMLHRLIDLEPGGAAARRTRCEIGGRR